MHLVPDFDFGHGETIGQLRDSVAVFALRNWLLAPQILTAITNSPGSVAKTGWPRRAGHDGSNGIWRRRHGLPCPTIVLEEISRASGSVGLSYAPTRICA